MEKSSVKLAGRKLQMGDNTNNKDFWNNYVLYWENKVGQANSNGNIIDKTSDDKNLETYFSKLKVGEQEKFLDFGCGSGRLFPIYRKKVIKNLLPMYTGCDVSSVCLEHAEKKYAELKVNKNLFEIDGLHIPFQEETFNKIICFGVFDACNQEKVLAELLRVLKKEGLLLITGKNDKYFSDDEEALIAERNARKKEHPNYFTDVHNLIEQLKEQGIELVEQYFFRRRGDFPKNNFVVELPDEFYEWAFILKKQDNISIEFKKFNNRYSKTYMNKYGENDKI